MSLSRLFGTDNNCLCIVIIGILLLVCCCDFDIADILDNLTPCAIACLVLFILHVTGFFCGDRT